MSRPMEHPVWRWEPYREPSIRDGRGPERVQVGADDPSFKRRPVGFLADVIPEVEPRVWDGDDS